MAHTLRIEVSDQHNPAAVALDGQYPVAIIRKRLTASELDLPGQRLSPGGVWQKSDDGGLTWFDFPEGAPPINDTYRLPPLTGINARCDAATRMVAEWSDNLNIFLAAASAIQYAAEVAAALALLGGPVGWALDAALIALSGLATFGQVNIGLAFTAAVWADITCLLYCYLTEDGQLSQSNQDAFLKALDQQYPGTVSGVIRELQFLFGPVFASNAGVKRSEVGNCSTCDDCNWSMCLDLTYYWSAGGRAGYPEDCNHDPGNTLQGVLSTWDGRPAWMAQKNLGDGANRFGHTWTITIPDGGTLTSCRVWFVRDDGWNMDNFFKYLRQVGGNTACGFGGFSSNSPSLVPPTYQTGSMTFYAGLNSYVGNDPTSCAMVQIELIGTGIRPTLPEVDKVYY